MASFIRPEVAAWLGPRVPLMAALAVTAAGLWLAWLGGLVLGPGGLTLAAIGLVWARVEVRRGRFAGAGDGPGVVEIDEGAIRYYGARSLGGEVALRELAEVRLMRLHGRAHWRLRTRGGEALLVPVDSVGAGALADAFAALPGADLGRIAAALGPEAPAVQTVWRADAHPGAQLR